MIWFMLLCFYVCVVMMLSQNLGSTDVANSATFICVSGRTWNIRYSTTFDQVQLFNYTALSVKVPSSPFTSFHTVLRVCHVCMFVSLFDFDLSWFVLFVCLFNVLIYYFFLVLCVCLICWFMIYWLIVCLICWLVDFFLDWSIACMQFWSVSFCCSACHQPRCGLSISMFDPFRSLANQPSPR